MLPLDIIRKDLSLKMSVSSSTVVTRLHLLVLVDVGMLIDVFQPFQISQLFMDHHWPFCFLSFYYCSKSTILRLLFRFYEPQQGNIYIDGQNIRDIKLESLRKVIGVVPQDTTLFNNTILHNIRYGRIDATEEEVYDAARRAEIHDTIMALPDKYNTKVGERGLMLSGGEKQRVSLARSILKKSPIVFLDEATAALDTHTEQALLSNIRSILKDGHTTSLHIAHRLRTVADAGKLCHFHGLWQSSTQNVIYPRCSTDTMLP